MLPELIELAKSPEHVVTIADFGGAKGHGVTFSIGDAGRAVHALSEIAGLIQSGRFSLPVAQTFPLGQVAEARERARSCAREARAAGRLSATACHRPLCGLISVGTLCAASTCKRAPPCFAHTAAMAEIS